MKRFVYGIIFLFFLTIIVFPVMAAKGKSQIYTNREYGFKMTLPYSWKGYSIIKETWKGFDPTKTSKVFTGPKILIRNPKWTKAKPWQDIPILIFTKKEWKLVEAGRISVSAAPYGPIKLGENKKYVFALPPRWVGFTDNLGQDEAQEIVKTLAPETPSLPMGK
jgi:hypothetical protein